MSFRCEPAKSKCIFENDRTIVTRPPDTTFEGFQTIITLSRGGTAFRPGVGEVSVQSARALHPPLATLAPPSGRVTKPEGG